MKTLFLKHILKITIGCAILFLVILSSNLAFAQPPGMPSAPDQAPIDGGLGFLAAAAGAYAYKKLKEDKK